MRKHFVNRTYYRKNQQLKSDSSTTRPVKDTKTQWAEYWRRNGVTQQQFKY